MIKSYKIRLLPNQEQEQLLWKHINNSRFIWNWGLSYQIELFKKGEKYLSGYSLKKVLTQLKQQEEYKWLNEVSAQTLNTTILDLDDAYKRFFKNK
jgi:putative transposase